VNAVFVEGVRDERMRTELAMQAKELSPAETKLLFERVERATPKQQPVQASVVNTEAEANKTSAYQSQKKNQTPRQEDWVKTAKCHNCGKIGHIRNKCRAPKKNEEKPAENNYAEVAYTSAAKVDEEFGSLVSPLKYIGISVKMFIDKAKSFKRRIAKALCDTGSQIYILPRELQSRAQVFGQNFEHVQTNQDNNVRLFTP
jgi:hypothetical protein